MRSARLPVTRSRRASATMSTFTHRATPCTASYMEGSRSADVSLIANPNSIRGAPPSAVRGSSLSSAPASPTAASIISMAMAAIKESNHNLPASTFANTTAQSASATATAPATATSSAKVASAIAAASAGPFVLHPRQCAICIEDLYGDVQ
eukprot:IDg5885t1